VSTSTAATPRLIVTRRKGARFDEHVQECKDARPIEERSRETARYDNASDDLRDALKETKSQPDKHTPEDIKQLEAKVARANVRHVLPGTAWRKLQTIRWQLAYAKTNGMPKAVIVQLEAARDGLTVEVPLMPPTFSAPKPASKPASKTGSKPAPMPAGKPGSKPGSKLGSKKRTTKDNPDDQDDQDNSSSHDSVRIPFLIEREQ